MKEETQLNIVLIIGISGLIFGSAIMGYLILTDPYLLQLILELGTVMFFVGMMALLAYAITS